MLTSALVSASGVAQILGVSQRQVYELVRRGRLRRVDMGNRRVYVPRAEVERLLRTEGYPMTEEVGQDEAVVAARRQAARVHQELAKLMEML